MGYMIYEIMTEIMGWRWLDEVFYGLELRRMIVYGWMGRDFEGNVPLIDDGRGENRLDTSL